QLPIFKSEDYFAQYEFSGSLMMGSSDSETRSLAELISMADQECLFLWNNLTFSYTETLGLPLLRKEIAKMYSTLEANNILVFTGAQEAIFIAMQTIIKSDDHVVVLTPCFQSHNSIPQALGAKVTEFSLEWKNNQW